MSRCLLLIICWCCVASCKKQNNAAVCILPTTILITSTASHPCNATAIVTVDVPGNFLYKLNNGTYQQNNIFSAVKAGANTITIMQQDVCSTTKTIMVDTVKSGTKFNAVAQILAANCSSCHSGINPQAGLNWLNPCDILQYWERIKARAADGNPTPMPPTGLLPAAERNIILEWVNAGHGYSN